MSSGADGPDDGRATAGPERAAIGVVGDDTSALSVRVRRGVLMSFLNNGAVRLITVLTGLVLARLLEPDDYGVFAVAITMLAALLSFNELGVSLALVRDPRPVRHLGPTVMTVSAISSVAFFVLSFAFAQNIATLIGAPESAPVFRVLSIAVLLDGLSTVPVALLTREIRQGRRLIASLSGVTVSSVTALTMAAAGFGVYSLVWSHLAGTAVAALLHFALSGLDFRPGWDRVAAREVVAFGLPLAGSSLLFFATLNVDYLVVGSVLGTTSLGFYLLAFNLSSWPTTLISAAVRPVALAGFSRVAHDVDVTRRSFERSFSILLLVTGPMTVMLSLLAEPIVLVLYGEKWGPAAPALAWLAVLGGARVLHELSYDLLVALDQPRRAASVQAIWLLALVPALIFGAQRGGIRGVAIAHACVVLGTVAPTYAWHLARVHMLRRSLLRACALPAVATSLVAVAALSGRAVGGSSLADLLIGGTLGGICGGGAFLAAWRARAVTISPMRKALVESP